MSANAMPPMLAKKYTCTSNKKVPVQDYLHRDSPALAQDTAQHGARQRPGPAATATQL